MTGPTAFSTILLDAQRVAGMLAARRRGDRDGASAMIAAFDGDAARGDAAVLLADLLLGLLAHEQGRPVDDVVSELNLQLAGIAA